MRILHVLDHSAPLQSGYTFRTLSILREQRRRGWETFQVTSSKHSSDELEEEAEGIRFYRTPRPRARWASLPVLQHLAVIRSLERRLASLAAELKPDILHAHSPALNGIAACRVGARIGVPVVYEVRAFWEDAAVDHGTTRPGSARYAMTRAAETHVLRNADAVTTICDGLRKDIIGRGIPADKVTVVPNAVDVDRFELAHTNGGADVVGFIGSFYAYEGLELLISAIPTLLERRPGLAVLLVGGGPQDTNLRERVQELGLQDTVRFTGRVPFDEVREYYGRVDVLVYPRLPMRLTETVTPLKPLEAMAMGKALVASDVGGHLELIQNGENGLVFHAGDARDLADKVLQLLENKELAAGIRERGRRFVERERTWERSVGNYEAVYHRLTDGYARA